MCLATPQQCFEYSTIEFEGQAFEKNQSLSKVSTKLAINKRFFVLYKRFHLAAVLLMTSYEVNNES